MLVDYAWLFTLELCSSVSVRPQMWIFIDHEGFALDLQNLCSQNRPVSDVVMRSNKMTGP